MLAGKRPGRTWAASRGHQGASPSTNTSAIRTTSGEFSHRGGIIAATRSESRHRLGRLRLRSPFPVRSRGGSGGSCSSPRKHNVLPNLGIQPTTFAIACDLAAQFLALAEKQGATVLRVTGHRLMGTSLLVTGVL